MPLRRRSLPRARASVGARVAARHRPGRPPASRRRRRRCRDPRAASAAPGCSGAARQRRHRAGAPARRARGELRLLHKPVPVDVLSTHNPRGSRSARRTERRWSRRSWSRSRRRASRAARRPPGCRAGSKRWSTTCRIDADATAATATGPGRAGPPHFDVVIVGSGYGGAIAASSCRAAARTAARRAVCVLERGSEYLRGIVPVPAGRSAGPRPLRDARRRAGARHGARGCSTCASDRTSTHRRQRRRRRLADQRRRDGEAAPRGVPRLTLAGGDPRRRALYGMARWPAASASARASVATAPSKHRRAASLGDRTPSRRSAHGRGDDRPNTGQRACSTDASAAAIARPAATTTPRTSLDLNLLRRASGAGAASSPARRCSARAARRKIGRLGRHRQPHRPSIFGTASAALRLRAQRVILAAGTFGSTEILMRSRSADAALLDAARARKFSGQRRHAWRPLRHAQPVMRSPTRERARGRADRTDDHRDDRPARGDRPSDVVIQDLAVPGPLRRAVRGIGRRRTDVLSSWSNPTARSRPDDGDLTDAAVDRRGDRRSLRSR